jgi:hypothetical protein
MPDETTFELASIQFGAEPVAVFRFGYERFELRARLGPGNLEHALRRPQRSRPASLRDGRKRRWPLRSGFERARTEGQCITRGVTNDCARRSRSAQRMLVMVAFPNRQPTLGFGGGNLHAPKPPLARAPGSGNAGHPFR